MSRDQPQDPPRIHRDTAMDPVPVDNNLIVSLSPVSSDSEDTLVEDEGTDQHTSTSEENSVRCQRRADFIARSLDEEGLVFTGFRIA